MRAIELYCAGLGPGTTLASFVCARVCELTPVLSCSASQLVPATAGVWMSSVMYGRGMGWPPHSQKEGSFDTRSRSVDRSHRSFLTLLRQTWR